MREDDNMKVLWLCRTLPEKVATQKGMKIKKPESWIDGLFENLIEFSKNIELTYLFSARLSKNICDFNSDGVTYLCYPENKTTYTEELTDYFITILKTVEPDCVHIFGTEEAHTLNMINAGIRTGLVDKMVIHIQGMPSFISKHYLLGIPTKVAKSYTFYDFLRRGNMYLSAKKMRKQGEYEIEAIGKARHVMGRTEWDYACCKLINQDIIYHKCWEMLRESFYSNKKWNYENCNKHSIFVSQGGYPVKGFHFMLEALNILKNRYSDVHLYITGQNPIKKNIKEKIKETSYSKYISKLINSYRLNNYITFLGFLDEESMRDQYLKSNVFVSCSTIENSSNSVGEAMMLGVPTVSSDVGGIKTMLCHEKDGLLYQTDAPYMLAYSIGKFFDNPKFALRCGESARMGAVERYNRKNIVDDILDIYREISNQNRKRFAK